MCGSPDEWLSTRNFAGCRSDSNLTPDRHTSRIRAITASASLGGELPQSPPVCNGAESNVICGNGGCARPSLIRRGRDDISAPPRKVRRVMFSNIIGALEDSQPTKLLLKMAPKPHSES